MKPPRSGRAVPQPLRILLALLFALCAVSTQAALTAKLDRYSITMGDQVRLTLRSDDAVDPADVDLSNLEELFEVLQRSSSVSTSILNGERSQIRELQLELTPRREGRFVIPPFEIDGQRSEALAVDVGPAVKIQAEDEIVIFEAVLDRDSVYVQGQLLLTLRVQQAVNLDSRSITELSLDNAYVEALGQNSFQRNVDGRPWLVHEIRYAIFPEGSGELLIPAQSFSGRLGTGRRSLFDTRPAGRLIRRQTEELRIDVMPRPNSYPDATWLPSAALAVEEKWSAPLDTLRIGDSVTRTITLTGDGLQGAQLPPMGATDIEGLRAYPDQPDINNVSSDKGVTGIRVDSVALVAVVDGEYVLPRVEIPWWNTKTDSLEIAALPERRIAVAAPRSSANASAYDAGNATAMAEANSTTGATAESSLWRYIATACALGWLFTGLLWWQQWWRKRSARAVDSKAAKEADAGNATRDVLAACAANNPAAARDALNRWLRDQSLFSGFQGSLETWLRRRESSSLADAIADLERHLYRASDADSWDGKKLAEAIRAQKKASSQKALTPANALPSLYLSQ
ncbi:MAG: BatD family protein [Congregibacter sp.]